jgi:hypothetical protein
MPTTRSSNTPGGEAERAPLLAEARRRNEELKAAQELEDLLRDNARREALLNGSAVEPPATQPLSNTGLRPKELPNYHARNTREWQRWTAAAENAYHISPASFATDIARISWITQYLSPKVQNIWQTHIKTHPLESMKLQDCYDYLLEIIEDKATRMISVREEYDQARQNEHQTVAQFNSYLEGLEAQMPPKDPEELAHTLFVKLRDSLKIEMSKTEVPASRDETVARAIRLENAIKKAKAMNQKDQNPTKQSNSGGSLQGPQRRWRKNQWRSQNSPPNSAGGSQPASHQNAGSAVNASNTNTTTQGNNNRNNHGSQGNRKQCHRCNKFGHFARECRAAAPASSNPNHQPVQNTRIQVETKSENVNASQ